MPLLSGLIFPAPCLGCGAWITGKQTIICNPCCCTLPLTGFIHQPGNPVEKIFYGRVPLQAAASVFYFTKHTLMQQLLFSLKYRGRSEAGLLLGRLMGEAIAGCDRFPPADLLLPLPLHPKKEKQRGYNQAALLCAGISTVTHIPVCSQVLLRRQFTDTQTKQDRLHRWQNMAQVFAISDPAQLKNKQVLLVDDVVTTGATLEASAALLVDAGCRVSVLTAAYTQP